MKHKTIETSIFLPSGMYFIFCTVIKIIIILDYMKTIKTIIAETKIVLLLSLKLLLL